ncbi:MAG: methyltransferase domain-containing protein [Pseudomonadota bacterium]
MGVDCTLFCQLVALSTRFSPKGRSLMLGRQNFKVQPRFRKHYLRSLRTAGFDEDLDSFVQEDGFSETLFDRLGFGKIETMDFASYEGPSIEQDLNLPVPEDLHGQFDFIFDGGTIEHVFNVPQALENINLMLKPEGRFVSANGMNGWVGHGMYQFNPELVWTFWKRRCQCVVEACKALPKNPDVAPALDLPDAAERGVRLHLRDRFPEGQVYLYYEIEKTAAKARGGVLQSDYQRRWDSAKSEGEPV